MVKKSSMVTSLLLGAVGGAAAAAFLATKTGQVVKKRVLDFAKDYQENHEEINAELLQKAQDLKDQAVDKYTSVKGQLVSGELTVDDLVQSGKETAQLVKDQSLEKFEQIKEKIAEQNLTTGDLVDSIKEKAKILPNSAAVPADFLVTTEDIEIDLPEMEEEA